MCIEDNYVDTKFSKEGKLEIIKKNSDAIVWYQMKTC